MELACTEDEILTRITNQIHVFKYSIK